MNIACCNEQFIIHLPLSVKVSGKKKFILNMNNYRNAHYFTLNNAKVEFSKLIKDKVKELPKMNRISLHYVVYPKDKRLFDVNNVCSVADKFFCDVLQDCGIIENDNYNFLQNTYFGFGEIDSNNPRITVIITRLD